MNKAPAYQWYPDKAIADMKRLSWPHKGIYRELLDIIWMQFQDTCSIPDDDEFIASELGCSKDEWIEAKSKIQHPYRPLLELTETNRLLSRGLLKEAIKQEKRRVQLRDNGLKGGRPKKTKNQKVDFGKPNDNQKQSLLSPSPSSLLSPSSKEKNGYFAEFYQAYPRHIGKISAEKAFLKALSLVSHETIMNGLVKYNANIKEQGTETTFIKYPATWLNQGCWDDEYEASKPKRRFQP